MKYVESSSRIRIAIKESIMGTLPHLPPPLDPSPVLIQNLTKVYPGSKEHAVDCISLVIQRTQVVGLLGPNAAGKSTTIRMIAGLIIPTSGQVRVFGYDPVEQSRFVHQCIGLGSESERSFYYRLTGRQNLEFFGGLAGLTGRTLKDSIDSALAQVGLTDAANKRFMEYSTGMKKRLVLARAHLRGPPLCILDEPTSGVDPANAVEIRKLLRAWAKGGTTLLLATHNMAEAEELCDLVAIMHHGRIVAFGPPRELKLLFGDRPRRITIQICPCEQTMNAMIRSQSVERLLLAISALPHVTSLSQRDGTIQFEIPSSSELTPIIRGLGDTNLPVQQFLVQDTSLEDVIIKLTQEMPSRYAAQRAR